MAAKVRKILFVDDQKPVLEALRRSLRQARQQWNVSFSESGHDALKALQNDHYDVIVSDIRMPEMDGVQLLTLVRERHPHMVRIAFSGEASQQALLHACLGVAHQFLPKPCKAQDMQQVLTRVNSALDILTCERLRQMVTQIDSLPVLPVQHAELLRVLDDQDDRAAQTTAVISRDIGLSVTTLRLANSAFFGFPRPVWSIEQAVCLLGLGTIRDMAMNVKTDVHLEKVQDSGFSLEILWSHSVEVGRWARDIAKIENASTEVLDQCFLAGMLHDVGKLVFASELGPDYKTILNQADESSSSELCRLEQKQFGADHAQVGALLLDLWGFDPAVCEAVSCHHAQTNPKPVFGPVIALRAANAFALDLPLQTGPGFDPAHLQGWRDLTAPALQRMTEQFS